MTLYPLSRCLVGGQGARPHSNPRHRRKFWGGLSARHTTDEDEHCRQGVRGADHDPPAHDVEKATGGTPPPPLPCLRERKGGRVAEWCETNPERGGRYSGLPRKLFYLLFILFIIILFIYLFIVLISLFIHLYFILFSFSFFFFSGELFQSALGFILDTAVVF